MLGWAFLFIYNNTMKFVQTLLESYNKLNEAAGGDVIGAITSAAGNLGKGDGSRNTITPPNGGSAGQVGLNDKGEAFLEGGPLAGFSKANVITADQKTITTLQNWWAGEEETGSAQTGLSLNPDIAALGRESIHRLRELEKVVPGITKKLLTLLKNARILEKEGLFKGRAGSSLRQKILGLPTRGSLAFLIEQEFSKGAAAHRKLGVNIVGFVPNEGLSLAGLKDSFDTMVEFSEAFADVMSGCDQLDHDTMVGISTHVVRDEKTDSFFFKNVFDPEGIGIALDVAEQNPLNLMAKAYNEKLEECGEGKEEYIIQDKSIQKSALENSKHSVANIIKAISEEGVVALFQIWQGGKNNSSHLISSGAEIMEHLIKTYEAVAFSQLVLRDEVLAGERISNEDYRNVIDDLENKGISGSDDILMVLRNDGASYFKRVLTYLDQLEPDFVVRVGGAAGKGDKSDVDYVKVDKPTKEQLPEGSVVNEVDFSKLSKEAQEAITKSGGPTQEKYWVIKDSLKVYDTPGDVKLGTITSLKKEARRLFAAITTDGTMKKDHPDYISPADKKHGDFVWDSLMPKEVFDKLSDKEQKLWRKNEESAKGILESMDMMSDTIQAIGADFKTGSLTKTEAKEAVAAHIKEALNGANLDFPRGMDQSKWIEKMMKKYKKGEDPTEILAEIDKTLSTYMLKKGLIYDDNGILDKKKSMPSLIAIAAMTASGGIDSTGHDVQSTIHIKSTGETHRGNQNKMILRPLLDMLDPNSPRGVNASFSRITIDGDGYIEFSHQRGTRGSGNVFTNTNRQKSNEQVKEQIEGERKKRREKREISIPLEKDQAELDKLTLDLNAHKKKGVGQAYINSTEEQRVAWKAKKDELTAKKTELNKRIKASKDAPKKLK